MILTIVLQTAFLLSAAVLVYVYVAFPVILCVITRRRPDHDRPCDPDADLPTVSLLVAAYNEELVIEEKVRNSLAIDYPSEKLDFVFVSDSTDATNSILRRYESPRVKVLTLAERRGKVAAIKAAFPLCAGQIVVFADANTYYRADSLRRLVRHFKDPVVGAVTGDVRLRRSALTFGDGEGLYYRYERYLQTLESRLWSTVAIDGGMYALRRELFRPPSTGLIADDMVTAMNVACQGYRVLYDESAVAEEDPTPGDDMEFKRKVRVVAYAIQSLVAGEGVPPFRQFRLWWTFVSHKVLRWLGPVFLGTALISNLGLALISPRWFWLLACQVVFYAMAALAWRYPALNSRLFRVPYYFTMVNLAALFGLRRGLRRAQAPVWTRTERTVS